MKKLLLISILFTLCSAGFTQSNWTPSNKGITTNFLTQDLLFISSNEIYAIGDIKNPGLSPKIFKSSDGGVNWSEIFFNGIPESQERFISSCYTGSTLLLATQGELGSNNGIYSSIDGIFWWLSNNGTPENLYTKDLLALSAAKVYAFGTINNGSGWRSVIYESNDGGVNWSEISTSGIPNSQVGCIASCYTGSKILLSTEDVAATNNGIYSSIDGISWNLSNNGIPSNFVTQDLLSVSSNEIYAIGAINDSDWSPKIYKSVDSGVSWSDISISGIDESQVMYNSLCYTGSTMLMSTHNGAVDNTGIYSSTDLISGVDTYRDNQSSLIVSNPITDKLTIRSVQNVQSITIANLQGRIVYTGKGFSESVNEIELDVSSYPDGLYLVTVLGANGYKSVKVLKQ